MKKFVILSIIIIFSTLASAKQFEIVKKPRLVTMHVGFVNLPHEDRYDMNGDLCGMLIVRTGIEGMNIDSPMKHRQINKEGEYWIIISPGCWYVDLKKTEYVTHMVDFNKSIGKIKPGKVYEMSVDSKTKQAGHTLVVISEPGDAEKWLDGKLLGKDKSFQISKGEHKLEVKKEGFQKYEKNINITKPVTTFEDIVLKPKLPAAVFINSNPEGAKVFIDGLKLGITPVKNFYDEGNYTIKIEKESYETINEKITITEPETKKNYTLQDIRAVITIKTYPNATIKFNDKSFKGGITDYKISPQVLQINVEMPKAETIEKVVTLRPKSEKMLEIYPQVETGTIQVITIPTDAKIELNGDAGEHYIAIGRETFTDVPIGEYELKVTADGHKTYKENFHLEADATKRKQVTLEEGSDIPANMVFVKGGTFQMGSNDGDSDEKPIHTVTVDDFYISKYEVTQKEWKVVMGNNPSNFGKLTGFLGLVKKDLESNPVENISWYDAVKFCNKKSEMEGLEKCYKGTGENIKCDFSMNGYRLPTEAEWEYAARGGVESDNFNYRYAGSNKIDEVAWYYENSESKTHPVGQKQPNELGIYDMNGNVWEWCNDWYDSDYYEDSPEDNPRGPKGGKYSVLRGGSWINYYNGCRVTLRYRKNRLSGNYNDGFRLSRSVEFR